MASSSRSGGAGGKQSVTTRKGRPAAKKAAPAGKKSAAGKRRANGETGVIAVKRAGVLPRLGRVRAPLPVAPDLGAVPALEDVLDSSVPAAVVEDVTEPTSFEPSPERTDEMQPYAELEVVARPETAVTAEAQPMAAALPETMDADDTEEIPLAELAALATAEIARPEPELVAEPAPAAAPAPVAAQTGMSWLMAKLRRLAGSRA